MKHLPGIVSTVIAPQDATRASEAHKEAVVRAAVALVAALKDRDTGEGYAPRLAAGVRDAQAELVRAVEGLGNIDKQH